MLFRSLGNVNLASNNEEMLLLELLPNVANGFLRKRRTEEFQASQVTETTTTVDSNKKEQSDSAPITGPTLNAPMGGRIISVDVAPGEAIKKGQILLVYEAMKMENDVTAERDGKVKRIFVAPGDVVGTDAVLIEFE